jgi:plastocyanin
MLRLLGILALGAGLALPAQAVAADGNVSIQDDFYMPRTVRIQPGEKVTWSWQGSNTHTVTADPFLTESFDSGQNTTGHTFTHTFPQPGRFTYHCEIHSFMHGVVEVGQPPFPDVIVPRILRPGASVFHNVVRLRFRLSEKAKVKLSLRGPSRRSLTRRLRKGQRSLRLAGLRSGRYRATLVARDAAGHRSKKASVRFRVI